MSTSRLQCFLTALPLCLIGCGPQVMPPPPFIEVGEKEPVKFDDIGEGYTVNAMVGQINGQPIYAEEIFREITLGGADLERLGSESTREQFAAKSLELIRGTLQRRIENELVRAEAERDLTPNRRREIDAIMKRNREKLMALHGKGSRREADAAIRKEKGHGLDHELKMIRERVLISGHMMNKIGFKVHVTQRDVKRHFEANAQDFGNTPTIVRVILVDQAKTADDVDKALQDKAAFDQIGRTHSILFPEKGGLLAEHKGPLSTFDATGWDKVNQAIRKLKQGQHTARIQIKAGHWAWAKLEHLGGGRKQLEEVYLQIESKLQQQQVKRLQDAYRSELLSQRASVSLTDMIRQLMLVALARYTSPEAESREGAEEGTGS